MKIADRIRQLKSSTVADRGRRLAGVSFLSESGFEQSVAEGGREATFAIIENSCAGGARTIARRSHKPEVAGSNPAPATSLSPGSQDPDREDAAGHHRAAPAAPPEPRSTRQDRRGHPFLSARADLRETDSATAEASSLGRTVVLSDRALMILRLVETAKGIDTAEAITRGICTYAATIGLPALAGIQE